MRILFLGNPNNQFLMNLGIELKKLSSNINLEVISIPQNIQPESNTVFDKIYTLDLGCKFIERIPIIKIFYYHFGIKKILNRNNNFDVISIQRG